MRYLITGGCGFIGTNLSKEIIKSKHELCIIDNLQRNGSDLNHSLLTSLGEFKFYNTDIRDYEKVKDIITHFEPEYIFHLAGQVAMTTSIIDPYMDFSINTIGTLNILEAVRKSNINPVIIYSSTNKVYGDLENLTYKEDTNRYHSIEFKKGFSTDLSLNFSSPYGCSKGAADQYLIDYNRIYGLKTIVFRHSSMYGGQQHPTFDQGWVSWFIKQALITKRNPSHSFTISGNGKQVRDLLFSKDVVNLYLKVKDNEKCYGKAFNIGGGVKNSLSILELFQFLEKELEIKLNFSSTEFRQSDQKVFIANNDSINKLSGWIPEVDYTEGLRKTIDWLNKIT